MKYQLIVQLPGSSAGDYDAMLELEEALTESLGDLGDVDGHDAGSGEMNIFIFTDDPTRAFERVKAVLGAGDFMSRFKAAYREVGKDSFTIRYPAGLTDFSIA